MKKPDKLRLGQLRVRSFVTALQPIKVATIKGGLGETGRIGSGDCISTYPPGTDDD